MRDSLDREFVRQRERALYVQPGRSQHRLAQRAAERRLVLFQLLSVLAQQFADERKTVGVHAARRQTDEHVAFFYGRAVDDLALFDYAHGKAREVVFALGIHTGHFRRFPAYERAAHFPARSRNAVNDDGRHFGFQPAAGEIVEEKHGFRALAHDVVDAHRHAVGAYGVVLVKHDGVSELGAHAVGARNEHRFFVSGGDIVEAAERAQSRGHVFVVRRRGSLLYEFDEPVTSGHVHAGGFVIDHRVILIISTGPRFMRPSRGASSLRKRPRRRPCRGGICLCPASPWSWNPRNGRCRAKSRPPARCVRRNGRTPA